MENVMIWGRFWVHHEADKNSMNSCQLIPLYDKYKIKTNWANERIEDEGYGMNNEWQTGQIKVPKGQSSREKLGEKEDRNEEKGEFSAACGIEKKIAREENEIEKNENGRAFQSAGAWK